MEVPDEVVAMMKANPYRCWLAVVPSGEADDFDAVARIAGVEPLEKRWRDVDRDQALAILTALLHRSLAYQVEMMPEKTAAWLAVRFLDAVGRYGSRYGTNCTGTPGQRPHGWVSATDCTMDVGIVAMGDDGSALYWVGDED